ncbi:hypothetical protein U0C82_11385 [Fulvimarina sp. 2208YS6-2-32]|uniref:Uncharacterized protein n=1 Tax=Fulvimarina uroteuthidis TaxID=3098149 RepID=A0ABU5I302_9HYPH|nr:hypothetical protein [Fulvimarina sp. 2208YS6-2-32]MDY8109741.1 hypothetical protein [Fulvimarina sp. 2208YS6-2-32]
MRQFLSIMLATAIGTTMLAGPAAAADLQQGMAPVAGQLVPRCDDPAVLAEVEDQFEYGAPRVLEADLEILEFSNLQEKAYEPQILADEIPPPQPIERRWCQGTALISDHERRTIYYIIEYPMGYAAAGSFLGFLGGANPVKAWRAEGCVLGLDEWHVYGANCQSLRRFPPEARTGYGYVSK